MILPPMASLARPDDARAVRVEQRVGAEHPLDHRQHPLVRRQPLPDRAAVQQVVEALGGPAVKVVPQGQRRPGGPQRLANGRQSH